LRKQDVGVAHFGSKRPFVCFVGNDRTHPVRGEWRTLRPKAEASTVLRIRPSS